MIKFMNFPPQNVLHLKHIYHMDIKRIFFTPIFMNLANFVYIGGLTQTSHTAHMHSLFVPTAL
jgi:hypothetical protein